AASFKEIQWLKVASKSVGSIAGIHRGIRRIPIIPMGLISIAPREPLKPVLSISRIRLRDVAGMSSSVGYVVRST
ncbi:MAG TPA: hypothetical protein VNV63_07570, partial [Nitrospiria bacterium]|nr:hypothetical protein [Nitrospiria bacterium]